MAFSSARPSSGDDRDDSDEMGSIVAEINITPLVDVFLVLLIIFMVTSSVMSQLGVSVSLPKASAETSQTQADGVIVTLLAGGKVRIAERELSLSNESGAAGDGDSEQNLKELLKLAFGKTKEKLVILEGDRQAFLGLAIRVMDIAKKAGAEKFAIATATSENSSTKSK